jgi:hypothetical protein
MSSSSSYDDELAGVVQVEHIDEFDVLEVLRGDLRDRNVVDIQFIALDQVEQEVEWPLEVLQLDEQGVLAGPGSRGPAGLGAVGGVQCERDREFRFFQDHSFVRSRQLGVLVGRGKLAEPAKACQPAAPDRGWQSRCNCSRCCRSSFV